MFPSRIDVRLFADQNKGIEEQVAPSLLQRVADAVVELREVTADLAFYRDEQGRYRVGGRLQVVAALECQRCNRPFEARLDVPVQAAIVWSDEQARNLPGELDFWLADEDGLELDMAVEDEILLALPIMPVHDETECNGATHFSTEEVVEKTQKPFAGLQVLKSRPQNKT